MNDADLFSFETEAKPVLDIATFGEDKGRTLDRFDSAIAVLNGVLASGHSETRDYVTKKKKAEDEMEDKPYELEESTAIENFKLVERYAKTFPGFSASDVISAISTQQDLAFIAHTRKLILELESTPENHEIICSILKQEPPLLLSSFLKGLPLEGGDDIQSSFLSMNYGFAFLLAPIFDVKQFIVDFPVFKQSETYISLMNLINPVGLDGDSKQVQAFDFETFEINVRSFIEYKLGGKVSESFVDAIHTLEGYCRGINPIIQGASHGFLPDYKVNTFFTRLGYLKLMITE